MVFRMSLRLYNFRVAIFEFVLLLKEGAYIPQLSSALRGALGEALQKESCTKNVERVDCESCSKSECAYGYLFATPSRMVEISRGYNYVCHPFVLEPELPFPRRTEFEEEEELKFRIILIGKGISYLPHLINAFQKENTGIGYNRSEYELEGVYSIFNKNRKEIYSPKERRLNLDYKILNFKGIVKNSLLQPPIDEVSLRFLTPTRLKFNESLVGPKDFNFYILFRCLLRRVSDLSKMHCGEELPEHYGYLFSKAKKIKSFGKVYWNDKWEHFSREDQEKIKFGGIVGQISFRGKLDEFLPFLKMCEIVHIGGKTAFGCGSYELV